MWQLHELHEENMDGHGLMVCLQFELGQAGITNVWTWGLVK